MLPPKRPARERADDFGEIYSLYNEATATEQTSRCICVCRRTVHGGRTR